MLYRLVKAAIAPVLRGPFDLEVSGLEHVPATGPVILAANHQAFCDSLFIPLVVPRSVTFLAKAEYFEDWKTRPLFRALGQIPMHREGGTAARQSLDEALSVLAHGGCVGIYPEGTRSPDDALHRGRTGVARLALAAGCPVVPVGVKGTRAVQPIGAKLLRPFKRIEVLLGAPVELSSRYGDRLDDPLVLRQATDEVMFEIGRLSGQRYVDRYANRQAAEAVASGPSGPGVGGADVAYLAEGGEPTPVVGVGSRSRRDRLEAGSPG